MGSPRVGYDHVRRVHIRSLGAAARSPGGSPDADPDCLKNQSVITPTYTLISGTDRTGFQARQPSTRVPEAAWLFPENLLAEDDQQHELLQVVRRYQRYRKRTPGQH